VHEIGRELDDIGKARALRRQRRADIGKDEFALRFEISGRLAVLAGANLAGDGQKLRRLDAGDCEYCPSGLPRLSGLRI
jgi:hypothetical protein